MNVREDRLYPRARADDRRGAGVYLSTGRVALRIEPISQETSFLISRAVRLTDHPKSWTSISVPRDETTIPRAFPPLLDLRPAAQTEEELHDCFCLRHLRCTRQVCVPAHVPADCMRRSHYQPCVAKITSSGSQLISAGYRTSHIHLGCSRLAVEPQPFPRP